MGVGRGCCRSRYRSVRGNVWPAFGPRQRVDVDGSEEVMYNSGCMGSNVIMPTNDTHVAAVGEMVG